MKKTHIPALLLLCLSMALSQPLIRYQGSEKSIEKLWDWAQKQAAGKEYYLIYTFERRMKQNNTIGNYRSGDPGDILAKFLYPDLPENILNSYNYRQHKPTEKLVDKEIAVIFRISGSKIKELDLSTVDLHYSLDNLPLYFTGKVEPAASFDFIIQKYRDEKQKNIRESLLTAAALHNAPEKGFAFLKSVIEAQEDTDLKENAIFWLSESTDEQVLPYLKELAMHEEKDDLAGQAVFAIYNRDGENSVDTLIDLLHNAKNPEVREKAIFWLGQLAGKKSAAALGDIVYSDDESAIQEQAVFALSQLENGKGILKLIEIAKTHPNYQTRKKAIFWLGESDDERAVQALIEIAKN